MTVLDHCPTGPDWDVDWPALREAYPWVDALHACPQDSVYHAEGDVGVHTAMACDALAADPEFRALSREARENVFTAVLMHDVAKPACTKRESDGRITSRGHSNRGDVLARQLLWREGVSFARREAICGLIRYHQVPFFLVDRADSRKLAFRVSHVARCDHLAIVARADGEGRRCRDDADQRRILDNVALFREYCDENECLSGPRVFASDHSRFLYFLKEGRDPTYCAHDDTAFEATLMVGLPAAGKDTWIQQNAVDLPLVSLDRIRAELGIDPAGPQARVVDEARQRAKAHLRRCQAFVWNATNLGRDIRASLISLFANYGARVRVVYLEAPEAILRERNQSRSEPVPARAIERMLNRWTIPSLVDAHEVVTCIGAAP